MAQVVAPSTTSWTHVVSIEPGNPKTLSIIGTPGSSTVVISRRVQAPDASSTATPANNTLDSATSSRLVTTPGIYDISRTGSDSIGLDVG